MPKRPGRDVMVGTFATLAILVLAVAVMTVGGESRLTRGRSYRTVLTNTDGLRVGSPVKMAGVQVGSVRDIRLPSDLEHSGIEVEVTVGNAYVDRIREDTRASQRLLQVLSGEKYVDLTPGTASRPALPEGGTIAAQEERELMEQGADIASNINEITVSLKNILEPLEKGQGLMGAMLHDPEFGKEGLEHLRASVENLEAITSRLRAGRGFAGRLLFDEEFAHRVDDISVTLRHLATTMESVARREGAVGALLNDGGSGQKTIEDLREAAASLRRSTARLEAKEGLLGRLLNDTEYSERAANDLAAVLHNLAEITRKIDNGQGTLGLLVNERTLHDGMEDVVSGVGDSKFARWLMRHYQKKGIVSKQTGEEAPPRTTPPTEQERP